VRTRFFSTGSVFLLGDPVFEALMVPGALIFFYGHGFLRESRASFSRTTCLLPYLNEVPAVFTHPKTHVPPGFLSFFFPAVGTLEKGRCLPPRDICALASFFEHPQFPPRRDWPLDRGTTFLSFISRVSFRQKGTSTLPRSLALQPFRVLRSSFLMILYRGYKTALGQVPPDVLICWFRGVRQYERFVCV